jgi:hypothetical protein
LCTFFAGGFVSQGCSPPNNCTPVATKVTLIIPNRLEANGAETACMGGFLNTSIAYLYINYGWRFIVSVLNEDGTTYGTSRIYNSNQGFGTSSQDNAALQGDNNIEMYVPSCGKYSILITVQNPVTCRCNDPAPTQQNPNPCNSLYMTWSSQSGLQEYNANQPQVYLLGNQTNNTWITYRNLAPVL